MTEWIVTNAQGQPLSDWSFLTEEIAEAHAEELQAEGHRDAQVAAVSTPWAALSWPS